MLLLDDTTSATIGEIYGGGFFAGTIRIGDDTYGVVVAPKHTGETAGTWGPDDLIDGATVATLIGISVPNFLLATLLVLLFSVKLKWLPPIGFVADLAAVALGTDGGRAAKDLPEVPGWPHALARKYPRAPLAFSWFWLFPHAQLALDPREPGAPPRRPG
mgnify:CR=1 FL=1